MRSTYHRPQAFLAMLVASTAALLLGAGAACASNLVIAGGGDGHGVGMSQEGALGYAEHGFSYEAILAHYYTGTALGTAPAGTNIRVLMSNGEVLRLPLETYVRGVVAAEMPASWPPAALEAQAVASRTYALTAHAGGARFDVYADTRSQVYRGVAAYTSRSDAAVAATAGQIVTYAGRPAITYFFASSGGRTENVEDSFLGSEPEPWLRGVLDPYEQGDLHSWTRTISFASAGVRLRGLVRGSFKGIEVTKRGFSPRIISANVLGSGGRTAVSGPELAARLGLYSTWAYFSVSSSQTVKPEPDRSGWSAAGGPTPTQVPAAPPSTSQGGVPASAETEAPASATAAAAGGGTSAPA
jgi:stage II sporulation protein D